MIIFDQLSISPDNKQLIIDVRVDSMQYFDNVEIDSIVIDSQDTFTPNGPSSKPIYIKILNDTDYNKIYSVPDCKCNPIITEDSECFTEKKLVKHLRLSIDQSELGVSLSNTMLFVYVIAKGYPSPNTPCGYDNSKVMRVVANLYPYYQNMMKGIKELNNKCVVPKQFIDNILRLKAIELSIKTGNYLQAIKYWKEFFNSSNTITPKPCGCYGRGT